MSDRNAVNRDEAAITHDSDRRFRAFYDRWAPYYDWGIGLGALLRGFSDLKERRRLVESLRLAPGQRVLEVSVGTGSNLPLIAGGAGASGRLIGLDISRGMLARCQRKLRRRGVAADLIEGEGSRLPFASAVFDGVLHFGGINEFGDKEGAIAEMMRVAKPGARIVIADEGIDPARRLTLRDRLVAKISPLYDHLPPVDLIPPHARDLRVRYFRGGMCYLIDFTNP